MCSLVESKIFTLNCKKWDMYSIKLKRPKLNGCLDVLCGTLSTSSQPSPCFCKSVSGIALYTIPIKDFAGKVPHAIPVWDIYEHNINVLGEHVTYLQVSGDGMVGSMGDQDDAIGLADQSMTLLNLPCMPMNDTCPHDGYA